MRVLGADDYQIQPWKNGLGSTTELAAGPLPGGGADFVWRLSIADVAANGPFSLFPNIDRVITVIDGAGMTLDAGSNGTHALETFKPFPFPGEWQIEGRLKAGPVRDFNLMVDRRHGHGSVAYHDFADGALTLAAVGRVRFIHMLAGEVSGLGTTVAEQQTLLLDINDAAVTFKGDGKALCGEITLGL